MTDDTGTPDVQTAPAASMLNQPATAVDADDLEAYWAGDTSPSVAAALRAEFPGYQVTRMLAVGQVRYVACRLRPGIHPHTAISTDPDKLRAALKAGRT
jgi:hypothetical protein